MDNTARLKKKHILDLIAYLKTININGKKQSAVVVDGGSSSEEESNEIDKKPHNGGNRLKNYLE
jgi:hypothetical protein